MAVLFKTQMPVNNRLGRMLPPDRAGFDEMQALRPLGSPGVGLDHPIHQGGPIDRYSAPGGYRSGGTGLAHAILVGQEKTRPVNPANRSGSGGLYGLLAASAQRAMEQQAQMKGQYHSGTAGRMRALQQQSSNLHAGGVVAPY